MREFRVWCENKNEWEKDDMFLAQSGYLLHRVHGSNFQAVKKETHIIEFYTGLLDKNGKKVFEGHCVRITNSPDMIQKMELIGEVIMSSYGAYAVQIKDVLSWERYNVEQPTKETLIYFINLVGREYEIIGNIHE